jgi:hypothetical protein
MSESSSARPSELLVELLECLANSLPAGVADFTVKLGPSQHEVTAALTPQKTTAASVVAHVDDEQPVIDVILGRGGFYEVPPNGRRYSDLAQLDEVRALCLAAIRGQYRETVWLRGDNVVRSRGVAEIGSAEAPINWAQVSFSLFRRARCRRFDYDPYDDEPEEADTSTLSQERDPFP